MARLLYSNCFLFKPPLIPVFRSKLFEYQSCQCWNLRWTRNVLSRRWRKWFTSKNGGKYVHSWSLGEDVWYNTRLKSINVWEGINCLYNNILEHFQEFFCEFSSSWTFYSSRENFTFTSFYGFTLLFSSFEMWTWSFQVTSAFPKKGYGFKVPVSDVLANSIYWIQFLLVHSLFLTIAAELLLWILLVFIHFVCFMSLNLCTSCEFIFHFTKFSGFNWNQFEIDFLFVVILESKFIACKLKRTVYKD